MRIYVPFYSRYGNVEQMARAVGEGIEEAGGEALLAYVHDPCTPAEVMADDERWQKTYERLTTEYPEATPDDLVASDGACFGTPTRFGNAAAPMRNFFDQMARSGSPGRSRACRAGSSSRPPRCTAARRPRRSPPGSP